MLQADVDYSQALSVIIHDGNHALRSQCQRSCFLGARAGFHSMIWRQLRPVPASETVIAETFAADFMHHRDVWPTALSARNAKRTEGISFHEFLVRVTTGWAPYSVGRPDFIATRTKPFTSAPSLG
jgi:hypothetical protein